MAKKGPVLPSYEMLYQAGIDPRTGLPLKMVSGSKSALKSDVRKFLRLIDEQDAVNRYVWYNLPCNITSQELERMLYYKGQLAFFYNEDLNSFYFMPYALDGTIDFYGRYNTVHPVPMSSGVEEEKTDSYKKLAGILSNIKLKCVYGVKLDEELTVDDLTKSCVLLHDYSKQLSQNIIPRCEINEPLLNVMAECVPFMRTSLLLATGIKGVRVADADQADSVRDANRSMENAALCGEPNVPVVGAVEFQELSGGQVGKSEEYMLAMQSLDNLRLSGYGIDNGGLFEKKAHELQSEADINGGPVGLVLQDGLSIRQNFCNIVNSIWGIGIWCEPAENIMGADANGDGVMYDRNEGGENGGVDTKQSSEGGDSNE